MSNEAAFLQAVCEVRHDDTPRLVFADWLDDRGEAERAEFIRLQCALARWVPDLARRTELRRRERQLLKGQARAWLGGVRRFWKAWHFERGLPSVTMTAEQFLATEFSPRADKLLAGVEEVRLLNAAPLIRDLVRSPQLAAVRSLDLNAAALDDDDVRRLAESPYLGRLVSLDLANNRLTTTAALALHGAPALAGLRRLDLRNNELGPLGVEVMTDTDPARLPVIELHGNVAGVIGRRPEGMSSGRVVNSIGMELVRVPAGEFRMGSPESEASRSEDEALHTVSLSRPFYLGVYTVTQSQFAKVMGGHPSHFTQERGGGIFHPVDSVTWAEAVEFCERLSARAAERHAGRTYRLPTEAEWEHACRAGTTTAFHHGDRLSSFTANFDGNYPYGARQGPYLARPAPVGSYKPNAFGLYDMHGNVWEWCSDWFKRNYYRRSLYRDPEGPARGRMRVLRGGAWYHGGTPCRSAFRYRENPDERSDHNGFRVVMDLAGAG
jgi:uncharacterized protein (TIGR02996 family)